ncbi:MAG TPA: DedA family protein [Candidatus Paceibacterota bacterium]|nr:DedA family protein [Candidatus Paceibacterota bacterium]
MYSVLFKIGEDSLGLLASVGYGGMFLLSLLDRATVFLIPSEVLLPLYGWLVGQGILSLWPTFLVISLGAIAGEVILFGIFYQGGRPFLERYGKYFLISQHDLNHLDRLFGKYGAQLVFWGRFLPVARALVAIPAGVSRMPFKEFTFYSFVGMLPYNFALIYLGAKLGERAAILSEYFHKFDYLGTGALVAFIAWYIYRHIKGKHLTHD